jgi:hypothetical protein
MQFCFFEMNFNIVLLPTPRFPSGLFYLSLSLKTLYEYIPCLINPSQYDELNIV